MIPFLVCLFVIGMPCMYLELAAGQYFQSGNITLWGKMNPYMKGIGYAVVIVNILMLSYYNTLQAYALYYLGHSFQSPVTFFLNKNSLFNHESKNLIFRYRGRHATSHGALVIVT